MMRLPGCLDAMTLGDVLGNLFRAAATGALELIERTGKTTHIYLRGGRITAVDTGCGGTLEAVPRDRCSVLRRLEYLETLTDAKIRFRVAIRPPTVLVLETPLHPEEFLRGRIRGRDRQRGGSKQVYSFAAPARNAGGEAYRACALLGVQLGSSHDVIKRAYRNLARAVHPDLKPDVCEEERRRLGYRFSELTRAYQFLTG